MAQVARYTAQVARYTAHGSSIGLHFFVKAIILKENVNILEALLVYVRSSAAYSADNGEEDIKNDTLIGYVSYKSA